VPAEESQEAIARRAVDVNAIPERPEEQDPLWTLERLLASPTITSKRWAYNQYDSTVRTNTVIGPGGDAAVLRIRGTDKAIAVKTDCNGRYVYLAPRTGGQIAVAEAARNVACTGARPLAITNCLNFGNPKRPEVFFQFKEAVGGMSDACMALGTPVTGGNVSFYNESPTGAVYPTPVVGMVGLIQSLEHITPATFQQTGATVVLLGECTNELGGSEYLSCIHQTVAGAPPHCDLDRERALIDTLLEAIAAKYVQSAHDCSDGGLAVALVECAVGNHETLYGVNVDLSTWDHLATREVLFGEAQGRIVVSTSNPDSLLALAQQRGVPMYRLGHVVSAEQGITIQTHGNSWHRSVEQLATIYHTTLPTIMERSVQTVATEQQEGVAL
jgi:phosphoribosylformylglycinamidine synthase